MYLTDLADVLRAAGLEVVEHAGWKLRGHGPMADVWTITCHHTAGPKIGDLPSLGTVRDGRPGLDGPLSQLMVSRSGVWHVIAAGLCWHAGVSRDPSYTNSHALGIEAEATGTDDWPPVQMDSYVKGARALANHYKVPYARVLGHKETCSPVGRKTDPNFDMGAFRAKLDDRPPATPPVQRATPAGERTNPAVMAFQKLLEVTVDGDWGPNTDARAQGMRAFARDRSTGVRVAQAVLDVHPDGIVGPKTRTALDSWVKDVQRLLRVTADGDWGPKTDAAYKAFRTANHH